MPIALRKISGHLHKSLFLFCKTSVDSQQLVMVVITLLNIFLSLLQYSSSSFTFHTHLPGNPCPKLQWEVGEVRDV